MNPHEKRESRWAIAVLIIVLAASCLFHLQLRNVHYQDWDSSGVYGFVSNIPASYVGSATAYSSLIEKVAMFRLHLRDTIIAAPIPHFLKSAFNIPFLSTYSIGPGIIYGLLYEPAVSYLIFMSRAVALTIILFHLIVLLMFFIFRRLRFHPLTALATSFVFLFAITEYSYGYHLGSTIWNMAAAAMFIWLFLLWKDTPRFLQKISVATAILLLFSYLVIFWWIAVLAQYVFARAKIFFSERRASMKKTLIGFLRSMWDLFVSQLVMIVVLFITLVVFYPPGQGDRLTTAPAIFFRDVYYVTLNFVSVWNQSRIFDAIQFSVAVILIVAAIVALWRSGNDRGGDEGMQYAGQKFRGILGWFFLIIGLAMIKGALGFAPDRHILFLAPPVFLVLGFGLEFLVRKFKIPTHKQFVVPIAVLMAVAGLIFADLHAPAIVDVVLQFRVPADAQAVLTYKSSFHWSYQDFWYNADGSRGISVPVMEFDPAKLVPGVRYLYVAQRLPFPSSTVPDAIIYRTQNIITNDYFLAYNPNAALSTFDYPNNLYSTEFSIPAK